MLFPFLCVLVLLKHVRSEEENAELRVIKVKVADVEGAGMDGGKFHINAFGGGEFYIRLCDRVSKQCCRTGHLNTEDDNWERGEINFFVGSQLRGCENFPLANISEITLNHKGPNGGLLDEVVLMDSSAKGFALFCPVGVKLDHDEKLELNCVPKNDKVSLSLGCNGDVRFCKLRFDEFTFAGTHNAGTGQASRTLDCFFKNQDLSITEQLDFGIRFFDLDSVFSTALPGCNGLETGHGKVPSIGIYQCFGPLSVVFSDVRSWLDKNPREVVVLYFGELVNEEMAFPALEASLRETFKSPSVTMNTVYKSEGRWPTLAEAVEANSRVFVFIRSPRVTSTDLEFIRELQVSTNEGEPHAEKGEVTVLSTYNARSVGSDCAFVVENAAESCKSPADLVKLAVMGSPGKGGRMGTECLWSIARKCNRQVRNAVEACLDQEGKARNVNFIQTDFPNYPANGAFDLVEHCRALNVAKVFN